MALARRALGGPASEVRAPGLREGVDVLRDEHGVPHIFAGSAHDVFFAQGFVHAEERLWQMDLIRRAAAGRLSEILGDAPVAWEDAGTRWKGHRIPDLDRWLRILGLRRAAERSLARAGGEAREALDAYAAGVNRFLAGLTPRRLPVEMKLLGYEPEPWTPADSVSVTKVMALELSYAIKHKLALVALAERLEGEPDRLRELLPPGYPEDAPRVVGWTGAGERATTILGADGQFRAFVGWGGTHLGSNWCVLGPERTTTGKPLLLNDPHVQLTAPSLFFPNHLCGGPYDVTGVTIPGSPGCTLGHNRRVAWGMTNVMADDADLYFETPHPSDPMRYLVSGGAPGSLADSGAGHPAADRSGAAGAYSRFELVDAPIRVRGERLERPCVVRISRHGPIISDAFLTPKATVGGNGFGCAFARGPLLALRWTAHEASGEIDAQLALDRARGWPDIVEAARLFVAPAQNVAYADVDGNFGYVVAGRFPVRAGGVKNLLPRDGARAEGEWTGAVPFEENPHVFNPRSGYLASANNKLVDDGYPHYISEFWEPPYRARRIHQLVREKGKLSPADGESLMLDVRSLQAEDLVHALVRPIADKLKRNGDGELQVAVNYLLNWDFACTTDSIAAALFHVFLDELLAEVFRDALGDEVYAQFLEGWNEHVDAVESVLKNPGSSWFRDRGRDDCVARALGRALARLRDEIGEVQGGWRWGELHTLTLRHAFHAKKALRKLVDVGPVATPGSGTTVNNGQWIAARPFAQLAGPGFRHVADLADLGGGSRFVVPGGVSGNPASPHRDDLFKLWLEGKTVAMPMERAAVERAAKERVRFEP